MKGKLTALLAIIVGFGLAFGNTLQAGQRPFHFSRDTDTTKQRVTVDEGNRMIDDIYRQFDGLNGLVKIAGYQALMMTITFDSISTSTAGHIDTFYTADTEGNQVRFNSDPIRQIFSSYIGKWTNNAYVSSTTGYQLTRAYFLSDTSFVAVAPLQYTWDTVSVLIIGRQK